MIRVDVSKDGEPIMAVEIFNVPVKGGFRTRVRLGDNKGNKFEYTPPDSWKRKDDNAFNLDNILFSAFRKSWWNEPK